MLGFKQRVLASKQSIVGGTEVEYFSNHLTSDWWSVHHPWWSESIMSFNLLTPKLLMSQVSLAKRWVFPLFSSSEYFGVKEGRK